MATATNGNHSLQNSMEISTDKTDDKTSLISGQRRSPTNKQKQMYIAIIIVFALIILTLAVVNLYQAGVFDSNDDSDDSTLNMDGCSGNGVIYDDIYQCECIQCYMGAKCDVFDENCVISAGSGQPFLFLEFWDQMTAQKRIKSITTDINYRPPYQSNTLGPFDSTQNQTFPEQLNQLIRRVHKKYHNVGNIDNKYLIFSVGASQANTATYLAWAKHKGERIIGFQAAPYYMSYPRRCQSSQFCTWSADENINNENDTIFEILTVPSNPTGYQYERIYPDASSWGLDLVYYWPHFYENGDILEELDAPITYFSFTKFTGHAGSRFGWTFVESYNFSYSMRDWISGTMIAHSIDTYRRAWSIFTFIEENGDEFFDYVRKRLHQRWDQLNEILEGQNNYIIRSRYGSQYGWLECGGKNESEIINVFESYNLRPYYGSRFGTPGFVRLNLAEYEQTWQRIMTNFAALVDAER